VELYEQIRREYEHGCGTIREVSRKLGVHRREVRKALLSAIPAARKVPEREHPKLAPAIPFINAILEADRKAPRKQRHTAHRIWMRMQREMPEVAVAESTIRRYVRLRKAAMGLLVPASIRPTLADCPTRNFSFRTCGGRLGNYTAVELTENPDITGK
jgi:hypothetical protein